MPCPSLLRLVRLPKPPGIAFLGPCNQNQGETNQPNPVRGSREGARQGRCRSRRFSCLPAFILEAGWWRWGPFMRWKRISLRLDVLGTGPDSPEGTGGFHPQERRWDLPLNSPSGDQEPGDPPGALCGGLWFKTLSRGVHF